MARDQLRKFLAHVWENPDLQDKLESRDAAPVAIAAAAGFVISEQEYADARAGWQAWQLSSSYDEETL
ncbi:MAG: Nif11-like leader peptide family RiPP precursor [Synechococcus sp. ELA057]|jgi:predicted ribosomally synthesized peptide with nif11-like leader